MSNNAPTQELDSLKAIKNEIDNQFIINKLNRILNLEINVSENEFPIEIFPEEMQNLINDAKKTLNYNEEFFSAGILSACATSIGSNAIIYNGSYCQKPIFWLAIVGRSGIGKTHPLSFATKPLQTIDSINYKEYEIEYKNYLNQENKGNKPDYSKHILSDFTPEKLAENLKFNERGCLIFKDELIGWINSFDQYSKGGDQQKYLELYNGQPLTVDRKSQEPIRVENPIVNIVGGLQPKVLNQLTSNSREEDGFIHRFLFFYPKVGTPNLFTGKSICQNLIGYYNKVIENLLKLQELKIIASDSNIEMYKKWQHSTSKKYFQDGTESPIQSKMETYVWRLALVVELIDQASKSKFKPVLKDENLWLYN